ncbi:divalent-cation tolerance protein CutA [Alteromonas facilis]|uniref:divalent-cation tolerance protein CutA n=1 Tax=Alteromonas facilis TaxID=2048004 RepID=UPI001F0C1721|nr:divalent-cation tolerance protein CutA [Alteromonas facilis]
MSSSTNMVVVLCTAPDKSVAQRIAASLVENQLAACVNLLEGLTSVYEWQGDIVEDTECQLIIKTQQKCIDEAYRLVLSLHPYDVPEWVCIDAGASDAYFNWMKQTLK